MDIRNAYIKIANKTYTSRNTICCFRYRFAMADSTGIREELVLALVTSRIKIRQEVKRGSLSCVVCE